ncbi:MAG: hypothetical protein ACR2G6_15490, partial [Gemmatimonadaceae bacterium]
MSIKSPRSRQIAAGTFTLAIFLSALPAAGQQSSPYHSSTAELIERGGQALAVCNGLFVSGRTLE